MNEISVIIVTFNGCKWISKCLGSINQSSVALQIIVIDNGSTDDTQKIIKTSFPGVDLIQSAENLGFGKANNIGIKKAYDDGADYVFLLNQDAWVEPDTIEKLIKAAKKHPKYGVISPIHLNGSGDLLDKGFYKYITSGEGQTRMLYSDIILGRKKEIYEMEFINAAAWLITRKCIKTVGGFAPIFHHYGEDVNYLHRVKYHELKIGVVNNALIYHDRERRGKIKRRKEVLEAKKRMLLIFTTNINQPFIGYIQIFHHLKLILVNSIRLRAYQLMHNIEMLNFVFLNIKPIKIIRTLTSKVGTTYLH